MNELQKLIDLERDARKFGFDWPDQKMILEQIIDECKEVNEAIVGNATFRKLQEEIGDLLHATISLCIFSGFDIEETLLKVNQKFSSRIAALKSLAKEHNLENLQGSSLNFKLELWKKAKIMTLHK